MEGSFDAFEKLTDVVEVEIRWGHSEMVYPSPKRPGHGRPLLPWS